MSNAEWLIPMVVGGIFICLGLMGIFWSVREQKTYDRQLTQHADLREFIDHWPARPEPGSVKVGGWIAVVIGLVLLILGVALWLWG